MAQADLCLPANEALLEGVRTSVFEFTLTWLSNERVWLSALPFRLAWSEIIFQGGCRPEGVLAPLNQFHACVALAESRSAQSSELSLASSLRNYKRVDVELQKVMVEAEAPDFGNAGAAA